MRSLSPRQRAVLARGRDLVTTRQENEAIAEQLRKESQVTRKQTKHGPVTRPPKVGDADQALDELKRPSFSAGPIRVAALG